MSTTGNIATPQSLRSRIFHAYAETFTTIIRSRVTWIITAIMLVAILYMIAVGQALLMVSGLLSLIFNLILALLTIPLTMGKTPAPWENPPLTYSRQRLQVQVGMSIFVVLLLQIALMLLYDLFNLRSANVPLLTPLATFMYEQTIHRNFLFILPLLIFLETILPIGLMLLLGARWPELGFCKGYHVWRVTFVWSIFYLFLFGLALIVGKATIVTLIAGILTNFFLDGLVEETLFRGTIQTCMTQLLGVAWGIGISGVLFGLGHFSITMHSLSNNVPLSLAFVMIHYGLNGIFAGFFFLRTRSLTALVVSHTLGDAALPFYGLIGLG